MPRMSQSHHASKAADFTASIIEYAPDAMFDAAIVTLQAVCLRRPMLTTDTAAAVGCALVYCMDRAETVTLLQDLDERLSSAFMVALARRVCDDLQKADAFDGYPALPSVAVRLSPARARVGGVMEELADAARAIQRPSFPLDDLFVKASAAMTEAMKRQAIIAKAPEYSPLAMAKLTTTPAAAAKPQSISSGAAPVAAVSVTHDRPEGVSGITSNAQSKSNMTQSSVPLADAERRATIALEAMLTASSEALFTNTPAAAVKPQSHSSGAAPVAAAPADNSGAGGVASQHPNLNAQPNLYNLSPALPHRHVQGQETPH